jgi:hypothetical protein
MGDREIRDSALRDDAPIVRVDRKDAIELAEADHDRIRDGYGSARK